MPNADRGITRDLDDDVDFRAGDEGHGIVGEMRAASLQRVAERPRIDLLGRPVHTDEALVCARGEEIR